MRFGAETYRRGALERLKEAEVLMRTQRYAGSIYFAGLSVEGMLRSLVWLRSKAFDERHDLRKIALRIEELGLLRPGGRDDDFVAVVQAVAARWKNDLRFAGTDQIAKWLHPGMTAAKRHVALRGTCEEHFQECATVIGRCEVLWQRHRKKGSRKS